MNSKIIVCYLCSPYANMNAINNFVKFYKKYKPGIKHKLIICFKNFGKKKIKPKIGFRNITAFRKTENIFFYNSCFFLQYQNL